MENIETTLNKAWNRRALKSFFYLSLATVFYLFGGKVADFYGSNPIMWWTTVVAVPLFLILSVYQGAKSLKKKDEKGRTLGKISMVISILVLFAMLLIAFIFDPIVLLMLFPRSSVW
jgi:magnesium-transporting ATPase (P-type)